MKRFVPSGIVVIALLLVMGNAWAAGPFVKLDYGMGEGDVGDFTIVPSHPVSTQTGGDNSDQDDYTKLAVGYRWDNGWYVDAGAASFGTLSRLRNSTGSDATFSYRTSSRVDAESKSIVANLGHAFKFGPISLFGEVGVHHYTRDLRERATTLQTNNTTFATTSSTTKSSDTEKDTDGVYTVGVGLDFTKYFTFTINATRYGGLDITTQGVGFIFNF